MDNQEKQVSISIKPEVAAGVYSNLAIISHSRSEFIIDLAANLPAMAGPQVVSRVLMTPEHAKRLMHALIDNVSKYESQFGKIILEGEQPKSTFNIADFPGMGSKS